MRIVLSGPKASGKSTLAAQVALRLGWPFRETDTMVEDAFAERTGRRASFREIWSELGESGFRVMERRAAEDLLAVDPCVVGTGGSTLLRPETRDLLRQNAFLVLISAPPRVLWERVRANGLPAYLVDEPDPETAFARRVETVRAGVAPFADFTVDSATLSHRESADAILEAARRAGVVTPS
jgi:shikimate kinase